MNPKSIKLLPEAWLCLQKHTFLPDVLEVVASFGSREEAEAFKGKSRRIRVEKDSPKLRVDVDGVSIDKTHHITMRENWLKRNEKFIKPCLANEREAVVFTWQDGVSDDTLATRLGGNASLPEDEEWPCCEQCDHPLAHVGTIDFRDTPYRSAVPADALSYFQCTNVDGCDWFENSLVHWLQEGEALTLKSPPQSSSGKSSVGEAWLVKDYCLDDIGYFDKDEDELKAQYDMNLIGGDPYFNVHADGVKIGGHPFWIQGDDSHRFICSCGQAMSFIAQFGVEVDAVAYIVVCSASQCEDYAVIIQTF